MGQPAIVIAHFEGFTALDETALDRLGTVGRLLDRKPLHSWDEPRAQELLPEAEVIVGHWGCPLFGPEFFETAANLRLFAYAAGSVKWYLSDELWERDILVTSGADANAEPVAEYTLAMILLANKGVFGAIDRESNRVSWTPPPEAAAHGTLRHHRRHRPRRTAAANTPASDSCQRRVNTPHRRLTGHRTRPHERMGDRRGRALRHRCAPAQPRNP